jgi:hypothetical protein
MTRLSTKALQFCLFFFSVTSAFAAIEPMHDKIHLGNLDVCEAPAPDSFRITKIGVDFISLAWKPAWPGADHQIEVFIENNAGGWDYLYTAQVASVASKTIDNLLTGKKYRFKIATKCTNGEPSSLSAIIDGITLIIELTLSGRTPVNPTPVNCQGINLLDPNIEWVGYRILWERQGKTFSSLFEIVLDEPDVSAPSGSEGTKIKIKRVELENPVVTANENHKWPIISNPIITVNTAIVIGEILGLGLTINPIGNVAIGYNPFSPFIDICVDPNVSWDPSFVFQPLVALKVGQGKPLGRNELFESNAFLSEFKATLFEKLFMYSFRNYLEMMNHLFLN